MALISPAAKVPHETMDDAHRVLLGAHSACEAFYEAFNRAGAPDAPSDHEQDLLRAMVVFASAGLDSVVKQLVVDSLPTVVLTNVEAREQARTYVERKIRADGSPRLLSQALVADSARDYLIELLVGDIRSGSLQSVDELSRATSFFAIPTADVIDDVDALRAAFHARNQISHEMDVDFAAAPSIRRQRGRDELERHTNTILIAANRAFDRVGEKLLGSA
jgi:hypothetical protein